VVSLAAVACGGRTTAPPAASSAAARNLLIVTVDTLRADHVGAYGYSQARTPAIDSLATRGVRFEYAYSSAPITLTSHATLMSGRYPPGHGARHNGMRIDLAVPTLADTLARAGFETAAFVGAFPLDREFGLIKGFKVYGDRMPRGPDGRLANERPGRAVVDEAIQWLRGVRRGSDGGQTPFFLWVHLFEPHAPYGDPRDQRPALARYDDEIAEADRQVQRLLSELGADAASTAIVFASDHGEAFGEHGEISHSLFVYDTTLRVPLVIAAPSLTPRTVSASVGLVDVAPTVIHLLGLPRFDADGVDLLDVMKGSGALAARDLYAESFAPLLDFGWSPLRSVRSGTLKYTAAPKPELFDLAADPAETRNRVTDMPKEGAAMEARVQRYASTTVGSEPAPDREVAQRLQALGYVGGSNTPGTRPDPKDRRELAARIAQVTSGELEGPELERALTAILEEDPANPQAHLRLGYVRVDQNRCAEAEPHFRTAIAAHIPTVDAHLGLAQCEAAAGRRPEADRVLREAASLEPDNPVVIANRGVLLSDSGRPTEAVPLLQRALTIDPDFHQARFNLAIAFARAGRRSDAAREADELLRRMPRDAPQRAEVERLRAALH
jgi:choline-sulfatase